MAYDLSVLDQGCREIGIVLNGEQRQQFVDFYEYLVEKNKVMNLTAILIRNRLRKKYAASSF